MVSWDSLEFHFVIYLESLNTWDVSHNININGIVISGNI